MIIVTADGYCAKQPVLTQINATTVKCEFAVISKRNVREDGQWTTVNEVATFVAWNDQARYVADKLVPGVELTAVGRQETSRWESAEGPRSRVLFSLLDVHIKPRRPAPADAPQGATGADRPRQAPAQAPAAPRQSRAAATPRPPVSEAVKEPASSIDADGFYKY